MTSQELTAQLCQLINDEMDDVYSAGIIPDDSAQGKVIGVETGEGEIFFVEVTGE